MTPFGFLHRIRGAALRRMALVAALLATLVGPALSADPAAQADHSPEHEPVARLQVIVRRIHVLNDHDGWGKGAGELRYEFKLHRYNQTCTGDYHHGYHLRRCNESTAHRQIWLDASSGDVRDIRSGELPQAGPGLALYGGDVFEMQLSGRESDITWDDWLGWITDDYTAEDNWGLGSHTATSDRNDYRVEYDVIRVPLADLRPFEVRAADFGNTGQEAICAAIENGGQLPSGPFYFFIYHDDHQIPENGQIQVASMAPGAQLERCVVVNLPAGPHPLAVRVDTYHTVSESNEWNNYLQLNAALHGPANLKPAGLKKAS